MKTIVFESALRDAAKGRAAHVLGNGRSRLQTWKGPAEGDLVIACNAAYRDTLHDLLVVLDDRMLFEVLHKGYDGLLLTEAPTWKRISRRIRHKMRKVLVLSQRGWWSTGGGALYAALVMGCSPIWLYGFDGGKDNVYDGLPCYEVGHPRNTNEDTFAIGFRKIARMFPKADIRVVGRSYLRDIFECSTRNVPEEKCPTPTESS